MNEMTSDEWFWNAPAETATAAPEAASSSMPFESKAQAPEAGGDDWFWQNAQSEATTGDSASQPMPPEESSSFGALAKGYGQGGTAKFADEATGVIQASGADLDPALQRMGISNPNVIAALKMAYGSANLANPGMALSRAFSDPNYKTERDIERKDVANAQYEHPVAFNIGDIGGSLALSAATGGALNQAGGAISSLASGPVMKGVLSGATHGGMIGGLYGLGGSNADLTKGEVLPTAKDIGIGAGGGALVGGTVGGAFGAKDAIAQGLRDSAQKEAIRASRLPLSQGARTLIRGKVGERGGQLDKLGGELLDEGIVATDNSGSALFKRADEALARGGQKIEESLAPLEASGIRNFNADKVIDDLNALYGAEKTVEPTLNQMRDIIGSRSRSVSGFDAMGMPLAKPGLTPKEGHLLRQVIDDRINFDKNIDPRIKEQLIQDARRLINQELLRSVDEAGQMIGNPGVLDTFKEGNRVWGLAKTVERPYAKSQFQGEYAPRERMAFGQDRSLGAMAMKGVDKVVGAVKNPGRLNYVSDFLKGSPQVFGKFAPILQQAMARGAGALAATSHVLTQQSEEYRALQRQLNGQEQPQE